MNDDQPVMKGDLLDLEKRLEKQIETRFATKDELSAGLNSHKDEIIQAIGEKFVQLRDHFDATIEHIEHDLIKPLHEKIEFTDEKVARNTERIARLEEKTGVTNPFPQ